MACGLRPAIGVRLTRMTNRTASKAQLDTLSTFWDHAGSAKFFVAVKAANVALRIGEIEEADVWMRRAIRGYPSAADHEINASLAWLDPEEHLQMAYSWISEIQPAADTIVPFLMTKREWDTVIKNDVQQALEAVGKWAEGGSPE